MTDEIKKAMGCCASSSCSDCGLEECKAHYIPKGVIDLINRQRETIQNQDEMIRALINAQETLQKEITEKDEEIEDLYRCLDNRILECSSYKDEIERLKSGHILYG